MFWVALRAIDFFEHHIPNYTRLKWKNNQQIVRESRVATMSTTVEENKEQQKKKKREKNRWPRQENRDNVTHVDGEGKTRQDEDGEDRCLRVGEKQAGQVKMSTRSWQDCHALAVPAWVWRRLQPALQLRMGAVCVEPEQSNRPQRVWW